MSYSEDLLFDSFMIEDDDDNEIDYGFVVIKAQYILDGASSMLEAADMARAFADYLESLSDDGYELKAPIQEDRGIAFVAS